MKILRGILTGFVFLIAFLLGLLVIAVVTGALPEMAVLSSVVGLYANGVLRLVLGIVAAVLVILVLVLLAWLAQPTSPSSVCVDTTADGKISITLDAINEMVVRTSKTVENVREVTAKIGVDKENNVTVKLGVWLRAEVSVATTVSALQVAVKEYVEKTAGIKVAEVRVIVEKTSAK